MARVEFAPIVGDARGRVAGNIFSNWRGVPYVKRFTKPGNPNTAAQQIVRNAFSYLSTFWKILQAELVTSWTDWASGKSFTNRNGFIGQGVVDRAAGAAFPVSPHNPAMFPVQALVLTPQAGSIKVDWVFPTSDANQRVRIYYGDDSTEQIIFDQEISYPTATRTIPGLSSLLTYHVWAVNKDSVSGILAASVEGISAVL